MTTTTTTTATTAGNGDRHRPKTTGASPHFPRLRGFAILPALVFAFLSSPGLAAQPPAPENPLLRMTNVAITPHIASYSDVSNRERREEAAREVLRVLSGGLPRREAVVNRELFERG